VLVVLRGAADGLAIAAPYGDPDYRKIRGELALPGPGKDGGVLELDGMFGLHPSLAGVHAEYERGRALVAHAVASPYRERSHFDGQDVLENGGSEVGLLRDGWRIAWARSRHRHGGEHAARPARRKLGDELGAVAIAGRRGKYAAPPAGSLRG
jgi:uncharacterized protein (DUF1501 family)